MAIITAASITKSMIGSTTTKIDRFNKLVSYQALKEDEFFVVRASFNHFGSGIEDVQFIIDAGYTVVKDNGSKAWFVTIAPKVDPVPEQKKIVFDTNIPDAAKAVSLFPSLEERKLALFKSYVDQELTKMDLFPFRVYLPFSMWGANEQDIQFVIDAGYTVVRDEADECWDISLPSDDQ